MACGFGNSAAAKFCGGCGVSLAADGPTPHSHRRPESREAERKWLTVLFADIVSSAALIDKADPEQALLRLEPSLKAMVETIRQLGGTVTRVLGDGVMALFGAPQAREDHALAACYAALAMHQAVAAAAAGEVRIRIGLHSGGVLVRSVGFDMSLDYDAIGTPVYLAARMEQLALPGTTIVAESTFHEVEGYFEAERLGPHALKGLAEPVVLYRLLAAIPETRWEGRATRRLAPFVGRESEMAQLKSLLEAAASGAGQIALIVGEPGIGKSRLFHELLNSELVRTWTALRTGSAANRSDASYFAITKLVREWLTVGEPLDSAAAVRRRLSAMPGDLSHIASPLSYLMRLPVTETDWENLEPKIKQRRAMDALRELVLACASTRPVLILVEDLHWVDEESCAILEHLLAHISDSRVCVIGSMRENQAGWQNVAQCRRIPLQPLDASATSKLVDALLADHPALALVRHLLMDRSGGTPLFLEETVRSLLESGVSPGDAETYIRQVPPTVHGVIASRIDRLSRPHKLLLQIASVIGNEFSLALLARLSTLKGKAFRNSIGALKQVDFIFEVPGAKGGSLAFRHALIQEVAYDTLLRKQCQELHAQIVPLIEQIYGPRADEQAEALAYHATAGNLRRSAVTYLRKAGVGAVQLGMHNKGLRYFREALAIAGELPHDSGLLGEMIDIRLGLRALLALTANLSEAHENLQTAEHLAQLLGDRSRLAQVYLSKAIVLVNQGSMNEVIRSGEQAYTIASEIDDPFLMIGARFIVGLAHFTLGNLTHCVELYSLDIPALRGKFRYERSFANIGTLSVIHLSMFGMGAALLGKFQQALEQTAEACEIAEATKRVYDLAFAYRYHGFVYLRRGDTDAAMEALRRGFSICREHELNALLAFFCRDLGDANLLIGNISEAIRLLRDAVAVSRRNRNDFSEVWSSVQLGSALLANGSVDEALQVGNEALDRARAHYHALEPGALRVVGSARISRQSGEWEPGLRQLEQAAELAQKLHLIPDVGHCHLALAEAFAKVGAIAQARDHVARASAIYSAHDMHYWTRAAAQVLAATAPARDDGVQAYRAADAIRLD